MNGLTITALLDAALREIGLFALVGIVILGIDDLAVDAIYFVRALWRRITGARDLTLTDLPPARRPTAVFVPAWNEGGVVGQMLRETLRRWDVSDVRIYAGAYPNDWDTVEAIAQVALEDDRVRLVIGQRAGPTTKADCLNSLWSAMLADEARGLPAVSAVVLHDVKDVVHPGELAVVDHLIGRYDAVQLPILPLVDRKSRWIGGTYLDDFAESQAKMLVVRQAVAAGVPFAGVGCAIARDMLGRLAQSRGGSPFEAASLTEDYELGLTVAAHGGSIAAARVRETDGGGLVAVHGYFPASFDAAKRQRARWFAGIALSGWDRLGWAGVRSLGDYWMRMRDRRLPLTMVVTAAAYLALILWCLRHLAALIDGADLPADPLPGGLLIAAAALLAWRVLVRAAFVSSSYGVAEGLLSIPRNLLSGCISLHAASRAFGSYLGSLRGRRLHWDKTQHRFPDRIEIAQ